HLRVLVGTRRSSGRVVRRRWCARESRVNITGTPPDRTLSVVLACEGAGDRLSERLDALARACEGLSAEVFAVHAADTIVTIPGDPPIPTTRLTAPSNLVPVLWGRGIAAARGRVVALTTTQFRVRDGWARALLAGSDARGGAGVGGGGARPRGRGPPGRPGCAAPPLGLSGR